MPTSHVVLISSSSAKQNVKSKMWRRPDRDTNMHRACSWNILTVNSAIHPEGNGNVAENTMLSSSTGKTKQTQTFVKSNFYFSRPLFTSARSVGGVSTAAARNHTIGFRGFQRHKLTECILKGNPCRLSHAFRYTEVSAHTRPHFS